MKGAGDRPVSYLNSLEVLFSDANDILLRTYYKKLHTLTYNVIML